MIRSSPILLELTILYGWRRALIVFAVKLATSTTQESCLEAFDKKNFRSCNSKRFLGCFPLKRATSLTTSLLTYRDIRQLTLEKLAQQFPTIL